MRVIKYTSQFKRDYKREKKKHKNFDTQLIEIINSLALDKKLPERMRDHALNGNWKEYRDCHIKPDLILIYKKTQDTHLELIRIGSHSELGI